MYNWYSSYCHIREKQKDLLRQAELWRQQSALTPSGSVRLAKRSRRPQRAGSSGRLLHPRVSGA